jgi:DNA-directed RNA polymerase specialized sigma24 family protein
VSSPPPPVPVASSGSAAGRVTQLVRPRGAGNPTVLDAPVPATFAERQPIATRAMRYESAGFTFLLTGLVDGPQIRLAEDTATSQLDVLALHAALSRVGTLDPPLKRLVECRYVAGSTTDETAEALGVTPSAVKRERTGARACLRRALTGSDGPEPPS